MLCPQRAVAPWPHRISKADEPDRVEPYLYLIAPDRDKPGTLSKKWHESEKIMLHEDAEMAGESRFLSVQGSSEPRLRYAGLRAGSTHGECEPWRSTGRDST